MPRGKLGFLPLCPQKNSTWTAQDVKQGGSCQMVAKNLLIFGTAHNYSQYSQYNKFWGCSAVVKVLCYKSEGRWFDPSRCQWTFH